MNQHAIDPKDQEKNLTADTLLLTVLLIISGLAAILTPTYGSRNPADPGILEFIGYSTCALAIILSCFNSKSFLRVINAEFNPSDILLFLITLALMFFWFNNLIPDQAAIIFSFIAVFFALLIINNLLKKTKEKQIETNKNNWIKKIRDFDPWRLKVYDNNNLTPQAKRELSSLTIVIGLQLLIDLWAWVATWNMVLNNLVMGLIIGVIFAVAILMFDINLIAFDTDNGSAKKIWPFVFRIATILVFSSLTALSVELTVFKPDIEKYFANQEKSAITRIRDKAITEIKVISEKEITDYKNNRELQKQQLLEQKKLVVEKNFADSKEMSIKAADESQGKGSKFGSGPCTITKFLQEQADKLKNKAENSQKDLENLQLTFNQETNDQINKLQNNLKNEINRLNVINPQTLDPEMSYKKSRGFLERYRAFQIVSENQQGLIWICRLLFMSFAFLVLGFKILATDLKNYYSKKQQQLSGHNGFTDEKELELELEIDLAGKTINEYEQRALRLYYRMKKKNIPVDKKLEDKIELIRAKL